MGIEAATSATSASSVSSMSSSSKSSAASSSSETSFKEEMSKVSETKEKKSEEVKDSEKASEAKSEDKASISDKETSSDNTANSKDNSNDNQENDLFDNNNLLGGISLNNPLSYNDANDLLVSNIQQMMETTTALKDVSLKSWGATLGSSTPFSLSMNESDATFFMNLTQNQDVSMAGITAQAQNMIDTGAEAANVRQSAQVSQTLLNALSESMQKNQPLRIDFDQNVSVILRVGKDGGLSAHFIPGDRAVEQYLKSNLETLKSTLREQDLPYTELSYSNSSKQQNERRRNKQQQGGQ